MVVCGVGGVLIKLMGHMGFWYLDKIYIYIYIY
jgi:hypothetical protein